MVVLTFLISLSLFIQPFKVYANPALLMVASGFFARTVGQVIVRRAAVAAANDAAYLSLTKATVQQVAKAGSARAANVPMQSSLRSSAGGALSMAGLAASMGALGPIELGNSDMSIRTVTQGRKIADNQYEIELNGHKRTVSYEPSQYNPVMVLGNKNIPSYVEKPKQPDGPDVSTSVVIPDTSMYHSLSDEKSFHHHGNNIQAIAISYIKARHPDREFYLTAYNYNTGSAKEFKYLSEIHTYEFEYLGSNASESTIPHLLNKDLANLPMGYTAVVRINKHIKRINNHFVACRSKGPNNTEHTCTAPKESDYEISSSASNDDVYITANLKYKSPLSSSQAEPKLEVGTAEQLYPMVRSMPDAEFDYDMAAKLFNQLLMDAASSANYDGLPFSSANPVTANELRQIASSLGLRPTQADWFTPIQPDGRADIVINIHQNKNPDSGHTSYPDHGPDPDLNYPDVSEPSLEETPTPSEILKPLLDLFPFLKDYDIGSRASACPVAEFNLFDKTYKMDAQCVLLEKNKKFIQTIFNIIFAFLALRIVLSA